VAALSITWLGHATFILQTPGGKRIVTDPWLEGNPACPTDRKRIDKAREAIRTVATGIRAGDFEPRPDPLSCGYCAFREICPASVAR